MKYLVYGMFISAILFVLPHSSISAAHMAFTNRIEGQIFDEHRNPVGDVFVELLNDVNSMISTRKASSSGLFSFAGLSTGVFTVRVLPLGKGYLEQSQSIQFIASRSGASNDTKFIEFYLRPDRRSTNILFENGAEAIFVQEIPSDAKKLYQSGIDSLNKNLDKGLADLEKAIASFPMYFDALSRLGKEYVVRKDFEKAYPLLLRAIDIDSRSYSAYYALAFSFHQMNQIPAALKAAQACTILRADATEGHILYGTLLRINGKSEESEVALKKALSVTKKPNFEIYWQLALLYNRLNRNKDAADQLELFLKYAPSEAADKKAIKAQIIKLRGQK